MDSGIAHVCALVTRVVVIFGPSDPGRWAPLGPHPVTVLRGPDGRCDSVEPGEVMEQLERLGPARRD